MCMMSLMNGPKRAMHNVFVDGPSKQLHQDKSEYNKYNCVDHLLGNPSVGRIVISAILPVLFDIHGKILNWQGEI